MVVDLADLDGSLQNITMENRALVVAAL